MSAIQILLLGAEGLRPPPSVEYLVVAGGGAGGYSWYADGTFNYDYVFNGGGGGAGGYRAGSGLSITRGVTYTVTVGAGGVSNYPSIPGNSNGSPSIFSTITSTGGGRGGVEIPPVGNGVAGGSGGGGAGYSQSNGFTEVGAGGAGNTPSTVPSQGNNGAAGTATTVYPDASGVFGGAGGGSGGAASGTTVGPGTSNSITGTAVIYGVGGSPFGAAAGTINTGNGGASRQLTTEAYLLGGNGGSGIVVIKYSEQFGPAKNVTGSPNYTVSGGFRIYKFTGSGSISW